jgi:hypothetical protein
MVIARFRQFLMLTLLVLATCASAQPGKVLWSAKLANADTRAGESTQVLLTAKIPTEWHIYGMQPTKEEGPVLTSFGLAEGQKGILANAKGIEPKPVVKFDQNFGMEVGTHKGERVFALPVQISRDAKGKLKISVTLTPQELHERTEWLPSQKFQPSRLQSQAMIRRRLHLDHRELRIPSPTDSTRPNPRAFLLS